MNITFVVCKFSIPVLPRPVVSVKLPVVGCLSPQEPECTYLYILS